jgi:hypothetical protein
VGRACEGPFLMRCVVKAVKSHHHQRRRQHGQRRKPTAPVPAAAAAAAEGRSSASEAAAPDEAAPDKQPIPLPAEVRSGRRLPLTPPPPVVPDIVVLIFGYACVVYSVLRYLAVAVYTLPSLPPRTPSPPHPAVPPTRRSSSSSNGNNGSASAISRSANARQQQQPPRPAERHARQAKPAQKRPVLALRVWPCISSVLGLSARMPWFEGVVKLAQYGLIEGPGRVGDTDGPLDR